jgi:hypothetical protein
MRKRPLIFCNLAEVEIFQVFEMLSNYSPDNNEPLFKPEPVDLKRLAAFRAESQP